MKMHVSYLYLMEKFTGPQAMVASICYLRWPWCLSKCPHSGHDTVNNISTGNGELGRRGAALSKTFGQFRT